MGLFGPALAGICLHRFYVLGEPPTRELVSRIIDQIIVPAATATVPRESLPTDHCQRRRKPMSEDRPGPRSELEESSSTSGGRSC